MKKITLFTVAVCVINVANAQSIPNNNFENWQTETQTSNHYLIPTNWSTIDELQNMFNSSYTGVSASQTTTSYAGSYAVLMQTVINSGDTVGGFILSCNSIASVLSGKGLGFPDAIRSNSLQGYYKFNSVSGDLAHIGIILTKWNNISNKRDTIVKTVYTINSNAAAYTMLNIPLVYLINNENPDTALIEADITGPAMNSKSHVGTTFYLDDLAFNGTVPLGVNELSAGSNRVSVYPNPFSSEATLRVDKSVNLVNANVILYNELGQKVKVINNINTNTIQIDRGNLQSGIYFYRLFNQDNLVETGKLTIE